MTGLLPIIISCLLKAAHFLRVGVPGLFFMWISAPFLLMLKRRWVPYVFTVLLLLGTANWIGVILVIWKVRVLNGEPALRMAIILGSVAAFTLLSPLMFLTKKQKARYAYDGSSGIPEFLAFLLTAIALIVVQFTMFPPGLLLERILYGGGGFEIFWLASYAGFLSGVLKDPVRSRKWRYRLWGMFSFVFFSQLTLGLSGLRIFLMTGQLHLPVPALIAAGPIFRGERFFMLTLFVSTILLVGPAWCSWLCYIGSWDNICANFKRRPGKIPKWAGKARIALLVVVISAALLMRLIRVPGLTAVYAAAAFGIAGVILMFTISVKKGVMTHCTSYCPMGLIAVLLGKVNPFRISIAESCEDCGKCTAECRYDALKKEDIEARKPGMNCTLCGDCIHACPEGSISYTFPWLSHKRARLFFVILIVSFHAVFLGVARI